MIYRALLLIPGLLLQSVALGENPGLKAEVPPTGSHIRRDIARGWVLPYDKSFEQLSSQEKDILRSFYENLAEGDEPPYPLSGLGPIVKQIAQARQRMTAQGIAEGVVIVDENGDVQNVEFFKVPDQTTANVIALIYIKSKFKPGLCSGTPCSMEFPFSFSFEVR